VGTAVTDAEIAEWLAGVLDVTRPELEHVARCADRSPLQWPGLPRRRVPPALPGGALQVSDVLVHEMVNAALIRDEEPQHNFAPWCRMIAGLSPAVLGYEADARPVGLVRIPNPDRETDPDAPKTKPARRPARLRRSSWYLPVQSCRPP
jgi:hypothetical protein